MQKKQRGGEVGYANGGTAKGRFYTDDEREAWGRALGLQSAAVRRAALAERDLRIIEGRAEGLSYRKLAQLFKTSLGSIENVIRRDGQGGGVLPYYTDSVLLRRASD